MKYFLLLAVIGLFGCSLDYSQNDPYKPYLLSDDNNIISPLPSIIYIDNGDYLNKYEAFNVSLELTVYQSMNYVTLNSVASVYISVDMDVTLSINGAPSGYRFYIGPYFKTIYEVN